MNGARMLASGAAILILLGGAPAGAQGPAPAPSPAMAAGAGHFASPEEGFAALAEAALTQDATRIIAMLGPESRPIVESGDPVADRAALARFAAAYAQAHSIRYPTPDRAVLQAGSDAWSLPIPMVGAAGQWRFDTRAGAEEILNRRIGANELGTIQTLRAVVDAQNDYARTAGLQNGLRAYARRFASSPGQRDGLYWETAPGQPPSPLGPLFASMRAAGYQVAQEGDSPRPINGYHYRMLDRQGVAAPGGATSYVYRGRMIGGFAVVAWPAEYGRSGIQTFMVGHDGRVWQRDLGRNTARLARAVTSFDPGPGWQAVRE